MNCKMCGMGLIQKDYTYGQWKYKKEYFKKGAPVYCSTDCSKIHQRQVSSETMAKTNKKYASERMTRNNPMFKEENREKVSSKKKGRALAVRMGNGRGLTVPQESLLNALSQFSPIPEYAIKTFKPKGEKYPTCYKPDIAIPQHMIAIEVDGRSHHSYARKPDDAKKDAFLTSLGWKVIRFWNSEIIKNLSSCVDKIMAEVARSAPT